MQVILLETIAHLGAMGQEVSVKPGYGRNFLLPQGKALPATASNREAFEARKAELEKQMASLKGEAEKMAAELQKLQAIALSRQASEAGMLYGSVKARDIEAALETKGVTVPRSSIQIGAPIKELGAHTVNIALHPEVIVPMSVEVTRQSA